jgi:hypothetical protein
LRVDDRLHVSQVQTGAGRRWLVTMRGARAAMGRELAGAKPHALSVGAMPTNHSEQEHGSDAAVCSQHTD